jgi:peptide/nickel transport system permease protein
VSVGPPRRSLALAAAMLAGAVLIAALAPVLVPAEALDVTAANGPQLAPPGPGHLLGTDEGGLSVLALTVAGARVSLGVGGSAAALAVVAGTLVGLAAGTLRRGPATALLWFTDFFLVLPQIPVALALVAVLRPGPLPVVLAIALTGWAPVARVVRSAVLTARAQPYLERVRGLGAGGRHLALAHLLPDVLPVVAVSGALTLANAVLAEAAFSFLGLMRPGQVSWGSMLRSAAQSGALSAGAWWYVLPPGLAVVAVVLAAGICANAVRTASWREA